MLRSSLVASALILILATSACQTVIRKRPRPAQAAPVDRAQPVRAWNALAQGVWDTRRLLA